MPSLEAAQLLFIGSRKSACIKMSNFKDVNLSFHVFLYFTSFNLTCRLSSKRSTAFQISVLRDLRQNLNQAQSAWLHWLVFLKFTRVQFRQNWYLFYVNRNTKGTEN